MCVDVEVGIVLNQIRISATNQNAVSLLHHQTSFINFVSFLWVSTTRVGDSSRLGKKMVHPRFCLSNPNC